MYLCRYRPTRMGRQPSRRRARVRTASMIQRTLRRMPHIGCPVILPRPTQIVNPALLSSHVIKMGATEACVMFMAVTVDTDSFLPWIPTHCYHGYGTSVTRSVTMANGSCSQLPWIQKSVTIDTGSVCCHGYRSQLPWMLDQSCQDTYVGSQIQYPW